MWVATEDLPRTAAHPSYTRLDHILEPHDFDEYVEGSYLEGQAGAAGTPAEALIDRVFGGVEAFVAETPHFGDMTMLVVRRT